MPTFCLYKSRMAPDEGLPKSQDYTWPSYESLRKLLPIFKGNSRS
ncbi:hypothetical protein CGRA01v4_04797 [Colletotrichum graminicola]|nr:hypothetical protein CGRA01v4_04797 [Colletotrichum graminicola]